MNFICMQILNELLIKCFIGSSKGIKLDLIFGKIQSSVKMILNKVIIL